jgi:hypothetical protein
MAAKLFVPREVSMTGPIDILDVLVIGRARVFVSNEKPNGCASGRALVDSREKLNAIRLFAL